MRWSIRGINVRKIGIPDEILLKAGRLRDSEYQQIQQHPVTTLRPYKPAATPEHAYAELLQEARQGWRRKELVEVLIATSIKRRAGVRPS